MQNEHTVTRSARSVSTRRTTTRASLTYPVNRQLPHPADPCKSAVQASPRCRSVAGSPLSRCLVNQRPSGGTAADSVTQSCAGQIVGTWESNNTAQPFLYSSGTIVVLPDPFTGGEGGQPGAINNSRQIAACVTTQTARNGGNQGFLYNDGTLTLQSSFLPEAINDQKFSKAAHTICSDASKASAADTRPYNTNSWTQLPEMLARRPLRKRQRRLAGRKHRTGRPAVRPPARPRIYVRSSASG
jgi:hypothetical protein